MNPFYRRLKKFLREFFIERRIPNQSVVFPPETSLLRIDGFVGKGLTCGIEILNDNETKMEFVVSALQRHARLDRKSAIQIMLDIHWKGGVILSRKSLFEAKQVAELITADARQHGFPLVCRAVSAEQSVVNESR